MIGYLEGQLKSAGDRWVLVDRSGVGWDVLPTYEPVNGADVSVWVTTVWREASGPTFYAHDNFDARDTFEALCAVHSVGPSTAASIVSNLGPGGLAAVVAAEDVTAFKPVKGVGPKTAARIISDVKLPDRILAGVGVAPQPAADAAGGPSDELAAALAELGFDATLATQAVAEVRATHPDGTDDELLAAALAQLAS